VNHSERPVKKYVLLQITKVTRARMIEATWSNTIRYQLDQLDINYQRDILVTLCVFIPACVLNFDIRYCIKITPVGPCYQ
jgi:hypothetical protein